MKTGNNGIIEIKIFLNKNLKDDAHLGGGVPKSWFLGEYDISTQSPFREKVNFKKESIDSEFKNFFPNTSLWERSN